MLKQGKKKGIKENYNINKKRMKESFFLHIIIFKFYKHPKSQIFKYLTTIIKSLFYITKIFINSSSKGYFQDIKKRSKNGSFFMFLYPK